MRFIFTFALVVSTFLESAASTDILPSIPIKESEVIGSGLRRRGVITKDDTSCKSELECFQVLAHHRDAVARSPATATVQINVPGISVNGKSPSDANLAVGPDHVVQVANDQYAIFDKAGNLFPGYPKAGTELYALFNDGTVGATACRTSTFGDPVVQYDKLADRWVLTEFAWLDADFGTGPYFQCMAVSKTSDPTGAYWYYALRGLTTASVDMFPDYSKLAIWPDAYYISYVMFSADLISYLGPQVCGYDRTAMLSGGPANSRCKDLGDSFGPVLVSDLESTTLPELGATSPAFVMGLDDLSSLVYWRFSYTTDVISPPAQLPVPPYTWPCGGARNCVPQPGTSDGLDAIPDRLMHRLVYRKFGSHESLLALHSVEATSGGFGDTALRWYEIRSISSTPFVFQSGTYEPDATSRWMGSIAINGDGAIAIGYSVSSSTVFPGIRFTYRDASDALGTLKTEIVLQTGTGFQSDTANRWGDYSGLQVDPSDDSSFWYTNQYMTTSGSFNWLTRVIKIGLESDFDPTTRPTRKPSIFPFGKPTRKPSKVCLTERPTTPTCTSCDSCSSDSSSSSSSDSGSCTSSGSSCKSSGSSSSC